MNHERTKAQVAYLSVMERAPSQEGAPLVTLGGLTQKLLAGGALFLRRAHPFSGGRALFDWQRALSKVAHRERALSQESAPLLRRARPFSGGHALLAQGAHPRIDQARIRHNFA